MRIQIDKKEFELMIEYAQIRKKLHLIGIQLNVAYARRVPVFIGVLNGSFMFFADLMKEIDIAVETSFIKIASYVGEESKDIKEIIGLTDDLKGRDVIIVEDIVDSGKTLNYLIQQIKKQDPASIAICTLLLKPNEGKHEFTEMAYVGFEISDEFVVGYGLDYNGLGRNFKDIYKACPVKQ